MKKLNLILITLFLSWSFVVSAKGEGSCDIYAHLKVPGGTCSKLWGSGVECDQLVCKLSTVYECVKKGTEVTPLCGDGYFICKYHSAVAININSCNIYRGGCYPNMEVLAGPFATQDEANVTNRDLIERGECYDFFGILSKSKSKPNFSRPVSERSWVLQGGGVGTQGVLPQWSLPSLRTQPIYSRPGFSPTSINGGFRDFRSRFFKSQ